MPIKTFLGDSETHDAAYNSFEKDFTMKWIKVPEVMLVDVLSQDKEGNTIQNKVPLVYSVVEYTPKPKLN